MSALMGGFTDAAPQSARAFRVLLNVMARPGRIEALDWAATAPAPLSPAAATTLLTLCDATTPLHLAGPLNSPEIRAWVSFHTGAPLVSAEAAQFALGTWPDLPPLSRYSLGDPAYPDRATTLIVEMSELTPSGARLTGPGVETEAHLNLPEIAAFQANRAQFPLGFDVIFTSGTRLAALPRSTRVEES